MKKLLLFLFCMVLMGLMLPSKYINLCDLKVEGTYYLYLLSSEQPLTSSVENAKSLINGKEGVSAEMIETTWTDTLFSELNQTLNLKIIQEEKVCDRQIYYGYSDKLKDSITIAGCKSNLQIVVFENKVMLGYPIIYNGY